MLHLHSARPSSSTVFQMALALLRSMRHLVRPPIARHVAFALLLDHSLHQIFCLASYNIATANEKSPWSSQFALPLLLQSCCLPARSHPSPSLTPGPTAFAPALHVLARVPNTTQREAELAKSNHSSKYLRNATL